MTTQTTGVFNADGGFDTDQAAEAILNRWVDAGSLSADDGGAKPRRKVEETDLDTEANEESDEEEATAEVETDEEDTEEADQEDGSQEDGEEDDEEDADTTPTKAGDDALVELTVDGETRTVSVKDLKRLYGQEASLTRKSQEVAQERKKAEETGAKHAAALQTLMARAQERFAPYENVDWLVAQSQLDPEEFAGLRQDAKAAFDEIQFLNTEMDTLVKNAEAQRQAQVQEAAKEAIADIQNPDSPNYIKDWSKEVYDDIRSYAVKQGLPEEEVNMVVNPTVLKILHKALQYDKAAKTVVTKKKAASAKRVLKSDTKATNSVSKKPALEEAKRFKQTGSPEDAAELMLARWKVMQDGED